MPNVMACESAFLSYFRMHAIIGADMLDVDLT